MNDLLSWKHVTFGATRAVRREVFTRFGPLNDRCPTEDTPILLRSLLCGYNVVSREKSILYRRHKNNLSAADSLRKMNIGAIYDQYQADVRQAHISGIISDKLAKKIQNWIACDYKFRKVKLFPENSEKFSFSEILFVISSFPFSLKKNIRFLRKYTKLRDFI